MAEDTIPSEAASRNAPRRQSVYVAASDTGLVKIGISLDPECRIKALLTGHGVGLQLAHIEKTDGESARMVEHVSHMLLGEFRTKGEWFQTDVKNAVSSVKSALEIVAYCRKVAEPRIVNTDKVVYVEAPLRKSAFLGEISGFIKGHFNFYGPLWFMLAWSALTAPLFIFTLFTSIPNVMYEKDPVSSILLGIVGASSCIIVLLGFLPKRAKSMLIS